MYYVINIWMPVATHGHIASTFIIVVTGTFLVSIIVLDVFYVLRYQYLYCCRGGAAAGGWSSGAVRPRPAGPVAAGAGEAPRRRRRSSLLSAGSCTTLCCAPADDTRHRVEAGAEAAGAPTSRPPPPALSRGPAPSAPCSTTRATTTASEHEREAEACRRGTMKELFYSSRSRVIGGGRDFPVAFPVTRCSHLSGKTTAKGWRGPHSRTRIFISIRLTLPLAWHIGI
jgi:hypothetical protein